MNFLKRRDKWEKVGLDLMRPDVRSILLAIDHHKGCLFGKEVENLSVDAVLKAT